MNRISCLITITFILIGKLMGQTNPWMLFSNSDTAMLNAKLKSPIYSTQYKAISYGYGFKYALSGDTMDAITTKNLRYKLMLDMPSNMKDSNKYGYESFLWGRRVQECVVSLDRVINSLYFSQAEKDSLMRSCDSIAWRFRDTSYIEAGINNRSLDELMGVAFAGVFMFPNNPNAQNHYNYVLQQLANQLTYVRKNDGSWPETARYVGQAALRCFTLFSRVQRRYAGNNNGFVSDSRFASILEAFYKMATPKDVLNKNRRGGVAIGDASWGEESFVLLPLAASEMAVINNTQLSAKLYSMWVQAGSPFSGFGNDPSNTLVMIDTNPQIDTTFKLSSFIESDIGYYMFRKDYGQPTESFLISHLPIQNFYHRHADCGSFSLFANNTPLMLDAGVGEYTTSDAAYFSATDKHNVVCVKDRFGNHLNGLDVGVKILDTFLNANYDYWRNDITPYNNLIRKYVRNIGYLKPLFNTVIVYDYLDTDSSSVNNLHTLSTSTDLSTKNGFNRAISHGYNNMDVEITSLLPNNQIFKDTSRLGIPSSIPTPWPRNLANQNDASDKNNCYQEWLTINSTGFTQYLTIIKPHTKSEPATSDSLMVTNNPSCLAYKVANGDTSKKYFIVLINKSKITTAQTVSINQKDSLLDLRTGTVYKSQNGQVQLSVPYAGMVVLIPANMTYRNANGNNGVDSINSKFPVIIVPPTIGTFSAVNKNYGDSAFNLTAPTSNSTGAFSYSISNTSIANVSGSTVTLVGAGITTITAKQAANGAYSAGSTSASLTVSAEDVNFSFANNGVIKGSGTVVMAGTGNQTIVGNGVINNLTINNSATVTNGNSFAGTGILKIEKGTNAKSNATKQNTNSDSGIRLYPNPYDGKKLSMNFNAVNIGKYNVILINSLGQKVVESTIDHKGENRTHSVNIDETLTKGIYKVVVTDVKSKEQIYQTTISVQ